MAFRVVLVLSAIAGFLLLGDPHRGAYDFQAFYCAGAALRQHADPYRTEPLRSCEHAQTDGTYAALPPGVALPAPQPPYDLALFALFSLLPFAAAKAAWGAVLGLSTALAIVAVTKVARASAMTVFMAFAVSLILPSFAFGQLFAVYAAACALAALFAERGNWSLAGIAGAASLVEPHLGLPVCAALAFSNARARFSVCCGAGVLVATSLLVAGWRHTAEYITIVLPLHALSEINSDAQLSMTAVLHSLGAPESAALRWGVVSYVAAAAIGVWIGALLAARTRDAAFAIAAPAAFAVMGGTFIHATEMVAAIPLALLLLRENVHRAALEALVLLSVPWFTVLDGGTPLAFAVLSAAVIFYELWKAGGVRPLRTLAICACAAVVLVAAASTVSYGAAHAIAVPASAPFPQATWRVLTDRTLATGLPATWVLRAASWAGLLILAGGSFTLAFRSERLFVNVN